MTPTFQPPPDGFDDALDRSQRRRRRRQTLEALTGAALAVGVAVLAFSAGPSGLTTLREDQPAATPGPQTSASGVGPRATSPSALASAGADSTSSPSGLLTPTAAATRAPTPRTTEAVGQPTAPDPRLVSTALARTDTPYDNLRPCADSSGRQATGWCVQPASSFSGVSDEPNTHAVSLCRLPGAAAAAASFPSTLEAAFALIDNDSTPVRLWSSENQHPGRTSRHEVKVESGRCLTWTLTWFGRNDDTRPTPAGRYALAMAVRADNIDTPTLVEQQYDYTVTD